MTTLDFSSGIYMELGEPATPTINGILYWTEQPANLGTLTTLIGESVTVTSGEFSSNFGNPEASIYQELYMVGYYTRYGNSFYGAGAYDVNEIDWKQLKEADSTIVRVSKNEALQEVRKNILYSKDYLKYLVKAYRLNAPTLSRGTWIDYGCCDSNVDYLF